MSVVEKIVPGACRTWISKKTRGERNLLRRKKKGEPLTKPRAQLFVHKKGKALWGRC